MVSGIPTLIILNNIVAILSSLLEEFFVDVRFTVGEMAKLNGISKQTLIFYDRENVFKPSIVDPQNGYRYYTAEQLEQLDSILLLRDMGFSLSEIRAHMKNRTGENTLTAIREQQKAVQKRLLHWKRTERRLTRKIETIARFLDTGPSTDGFIQCEADYFAIEKTEPPHGLLEVDMAVKRLLSRATACGYAHYYQIGDAVPEENLLRGDFIRFAFAFLPLDSPDGVEELYVKPEGMYCRGYHTGPYSEIESTYRRLLRKLDDAGYSPSGCAYEYCVLDSLTTRDPKDYMTEIQIPVVPRRHV